MQFYMNMISVTKHETKTVLHGKIRRYDLLYTVIYLNLSKLSNKSLRMIK